MVRVEVGAETTFELHRLTILPDGDTYVVGRPEAGSYVALDGVALDVLHRLASGQPLGRIKRDLRRETGEAEVVLGDFVERLVEARLVRRVDGAALGDVRGAGTPEARPPASLLRWACSPVAAALYALVGAAAVVVAILDPGPTLIGPSTLVASWGYPAATLAALLLGWILVGKHEAAHWMAARALGVPARVSLGHRLVFPVLQTNLTALWSVPRRKRMPVYLAGMVSDALAAAGAVLALALLGPPGGGALRALEGVLHLTVLLSLAAMVWQLCWFMRTDVYFVLADLMRCRNLHEDAWSYLRSWPRAWRTWLARGRSPASSSRSGTPRRAVRAYALFLLAGTALYLGLFGAYAVGTLAFVLTGSAPGLFAYGGGGSAADRASAGLVFGLLVTLVGASMWRTRRRDESETRYHVVAPPGL